MPFFENMFARQSSDLQFLRNVACKLHQRMIEEGGPALDRRCHAHVVLLHQEFHKIGLNIGVEQPLQRLARRAFPIFEHVFVCRALRAFAPRRLADPPDLPRRRRKRNYRNKRRPRVAVACEKGVGQFAPDCRPDPPRVGDRSTNSSAYAARHHTPVGPVPSRILQGEFVSRVSPQSFVRTLARQNDGDPPELRHEIQRNARRPNDGLVLMPDQKRQGLKETLLADENFVVN
jgi:hypothetical protein